MAMRIKDTVALVTGANRGIGKALTEALLARGARRVYAAARNPASGRELADANRDRVVSLRLDVTDADEIRAAAARAGDVQLLINNAGALLHSSAPITDAKWIEAGRREMDVNLFGTFAVTQAFAPVLAKNGGGAIVNVVSVAGFVNFPLFVSYSLSKAALHSLTQASRLLLKGQGIQVIGAYPGPVDTDMAAQVSFAKAAPLDVAHAILDGVEAGRQEILPDPMARQLGELFLQNPKELEQQIAAMVAA